MSKVPVDRLAIAVAQLNPIVGDVSGNLERARIARAEAARDGADVVAFSELFIAGYPPEDLVLKPAFQAACRSAVEALARATGDGGPAVLVGTPWVEEGKLHNAYALLAGGRIEAIRFKVNLPNYGVFDEKRVFAPGPVPGPVNFGGVRLGLPICEDTWTDWGDYENVVECLAETGAELILVPNGSPYWRDKADTRLNVSIARVTEAGLPLIYVNQVGGQDELVFDGASFVADATGSVVQQLPGWHETAALVTLDSGVPRPVRGTLDPRLEYHVYEALVMGVRDYVAKNRFPGVLLGLSGGVDSALVLAVAVDALGRDRVRAVMMPSPYTRPISLEDARAMAATVGVHYSEIAIEPMFAAFRTALAGEFEGLAPDATEENIQARIRGTLLMALSNKLGSIVLTTGNKSEMAVGYATLYGDMAGGFGVLKDISKTLVYRLCAYRNALGRVIPERIITRPPSAELRADQVDQDSLPPYDALDGILEAYVELDRSPAEIIAMGFAPEHVRQVVRLIKINEYKRRQAAVGIRITPRGFGRDWRYPITSAWHEWENVASGGPPPAPTIV